MGLVLVDISLTPNEEIALKAIQKINGDCQKTIDAAYAKRRLESDRVMIKYVDDNAEYAVGDMLKTKQLEKYMRVESISARVHFGSHVVITYHGKPMKKVRGEFVPTIMVEQAELTESNAVLIQKA